MINYRNLDTVKIALDNMIDAVEAARNRLQADLTLTVDGCNRYDATHPGSPETAAVRRASMDLTRALANLRRPMAPRQETETP